MLQVPIYSYGSFIGVSSTAKRETFYLFAQSHWQRYNTDFREKGFFVRYLYCFVLTFLFVSLSSCSSDHHSDYLGYIEGRYTYLSSQVPGHLAQLLIHKGETVTAGQAAFVLDPEPELSQLKEVQATLAAETHKLSDLEKPQREEVLNQLRANVRKAESQVELSQKMHERDIALRKTAAISQAAFDRSKNTYLADLASLHSAKAALAEAQLGARSDAIAAQKSVVKAAQAKVSHLTWLLGQKRITIPKSGVIEDTFYRVGEFVPSAKPVASLLTPDNRYLIFYIPQQLRSQLKIGQRIYFTCDHCKKDVPAKIAFIATRAEYTPPVIYSKDSRDKLVYYVEAVMTESTAKQFQPGQPIQVRLSKKDD